MKTTYTSFVLTIAFTMGVMATSFISGCQKVPPPVAEGETDDLELAVEIPDSTEEIVDLSDAEMSEEESSPAEEATSSEPAEEAASNETTEETAAEESSPAAAEESKPAETAAAETTTDETTADESAPAAEESSEPVAAAAGRPGDWSQWGGNSLRNNTPQGKNIPTDWAIGEFDRKTGEWISDEARNIKWVSRVGSQTYGNPVVSDHRAYVGTNNGAGWLPRYPADTDLGCLLCFDEASGKFLWQDSSEKLPTGRVHDWPLQGICCAPMIEGKRLWYVTSRGEVKCLDTEGYYDNEDDGPVTNELGRLFDLMTNEDPEKDQVAPIVAGLGEGSATDVLRERFAARGEELPAEVSVTAADTGRKWTLAAKVNGADREFIVQVIGPKLSAFKKITVDDKNEADTIWSYDMMSELRVSQHNMCSCSVTALGDILFVNTSNGVDESHINIPSPDAPSFIAMNKKTGEVYWTDKSPGLNILHGQWSSPTVATLGGVPQVVFGGGDGWVYSFKADEGKDGKPELLWKFDANPKDSKWVLGGRGTRNNIIATPVVYDDLVYVAVGQDPEHGEGIGHLWCIDPNKRGDVSPQLARKGDEPVEHRRLQAVIEEEGETAIENPNSAALWHYSEFDQNGDGEFDFEETMHRSCGTVAIKNDLLYIADFSGLFHCLNAKTGKVNWTYDMLAAAWGSPLIVEDHVYIGDEDGDLAIFKLAADPKVAMKEVDDELMPINADEYGDVTNMGNSVYSTPIVANNVLFISNKTHLFAIAPDDVAAE